MINLENVTLLTIDGSGNDLNAIKALKYSANKIKFGAIKYITSGDYIPNFCETFKISKLTWNEYNKFCIKNLNEYVNTDFVLLIQSDGFVINPDKWDSEFLNYDYLGAPWGMNNLSYNIPKFPIILEECLKNKKVNQIGNGGFTLRSKLLLEHISTMYKPEHNGLPEDALICNLYRTVLQNAGLKFTNNIDFAATFSCEATVVDGKIYSSDNSFGFHCDETHPDKVKLLDTIEEKEIL